MPFDSPDDCSLTFDDLLGQIVNPTAIANFLNPNYIAPNTVSAYAILCYYGVTPYDFGPLHIRASVSITDRSGMQVSSARFQIDDSHIPFSNLPFLPIPPMRWEIWNSPPANRTPSTLIVSSADSTHITITTGEGVNFAIHNKLKIETANGYEFRTITGIATDTLELDAPLFGLPTIGGKIWTCVIYFRGRQRGAVQPRVIRKRDDPTSSQFNTDIRVLEIELSDLTGDFKRNPVKEVYENVTTYFIMKDVGTRYVPTFDFSGIDTSKGYLIRRKTFNADLPSQIFEWCLNAEVDATIWIDPETLAVSIGPKADIQNKVLTIDDTNVYERWFDKNTFTIGQNFDVMKNSVQFWYNKKLPAVINVTNGSETVLANTVVGPPLPSWLSKLKVANNASGSVAASDPVQMTTSAVDDNTVYTVTYVASDTDIRISPAWKGATNSTGIEASFTGSRGVVVVDDINSILLMQQILNESGDLAGEFGIVIQNQPNMMTEEEALEYANIYLSRLAANLITSGKADTTNDLTQLGDLVLRAGHVLGIDLSLSWGVNGDVVVHEVVTKSTGAVKENGDPLHKVSLSFKDPIGSLDNQLDRMMSDLKKVVVIDNAVIEILLMIREQVLLADCVHVDSPDSSDDILEIGDEIETDDADVEIMMSEYSFTWDRYNHPVTVGDGVGTPTNYEMLLSEYGFTQDDFNYPLAA